MIRNIPSTGIDEIELRNLFKGCEEEWKKKVGEAKRLTKGVKIVKPKDKGTDGKNLGFGFIEFFDEEFAKYCIMHWNNKPMEKGNKRKLILDFALQDARVQQKLEDRRKKRKELDAIGKVRKEKAKTEEELKEEE